MSYYHRKNRKSWEELKYYALFMLAMFGICALYGLAADPPLSEKVEKMDRVIAEAERRAKESLK